MSNGLGELVAHAHGLRRACWHVVVEAVGEGRALALRVGFLLVIKFRGKLGVVGDIAVGELDFCTLLFSGVGGRRVGAEGVLQVLLVGLCELRGDGLEGGKNGVGDAKGLLRVGGEGRGEMDEVEFGGAGGC